MNRVLLQMRRDITPSKEFIQGALWAGKWSTAGTLYFTLLMFYPGLACLFALVVIGWEWYRSADRRSRS